jgi:hypothetical protein
MRWTIKKPSEETVKHLATALNVEDFVYIISATWH